MGRVGTVSSDLEMEQQDSRALYQGYIMRRAGGRERMRDYPLASATALCVFYHSQIKF